MREGSNRAGRPELTFVNAMSANVAGQSSTDYYPESVLLDVYPANRELSATVQYGPTWAEKNQLF
jgi:hypothetical protein